MLLDHSLDDASVKRIEDIIRAEKGIESFHYLKTRKSGDDVFVEAHIVFSDKDILLSAAHSIGEGIEEKIDTALDGATTILHLDLDPTPENEGKK